jgi:cyclic pyranopterin phosphate synthase
METISAVMTHFDAGPPSRVEVRGLCRLYTHFMSELSHVRADGSVRMVDVSGKATSSRVARAEGLLRITDAHRAALGSLPKGDALTIAQIAGIQGGKRCSELIPLCHPVFLSDLDVEIRVEANGIRIGATARTEAQTGVEMEAYTAVVVAGITLIDMLKGVHPDLCLEQVRLVEKSGGKQQWLRIGEKLEAQG